MSSRGPKGRSNLQPVDIWLCFSASRSACIFIKNYIYSIYVILTFLKLALFCKLATKVQRHKVGDGNVIASTSAATRQVSRKT